MQWNSLHYLVDEGEVGFESQTPNITKIVSTTRLSLHYCWFKMT